MKNCALLCACCAALWCAGRARAATPPEGNINVGDPAPEIKATGWLNSSPLTIKGSKGHVIVLEFIETTCPSCQDFAAQFEALYQKYGSQGVVFMSSDYEAEALVAAFVQKYGITSPVGCKSLSYWTYGIPGFPTTYVIDPNGIVTFVQPGFELPDYALEPAIVQALGGGGASTSPSITVASPPATPPPVAAGQPVALSVAASAASGDGLLYTWNFGDGAAGAGASVTHTYANPGLYTATVTICDGALCTSETVTVAVNPPGGAPDPAQFKVSKGSLKFVFNKTPADSMSFTGTLPVAAGFSPNQKSLQVCIGGYTSTFTLNALGKGGNPTGTDSLALSGKRGAAGGYTASPVKFTYAVKKQSLYASLRVLGFSSGKSVTVPVLMDLDGGSYLGSVQVTYTANSKTGSAK